MLAGRLVLGAFVIVVAIRGRRCNPIASRSPAHLASMIQAP